MNKQPVFKWTHYPSECEYCLECVDTCKCIKITSLKRIIHDDTCCTRCECCSETCKAITTEFIFDLTGSENTETEEV